MTQATTATSPSINGGKKIVSKFKSKNANNVKSPTMSRSPSIHNAT